MHNLYSDNDIRKAIIECLPRRKVRTVFNDDEEIVSNLFKTFMKKDLKTRMDRKKI